MTVHAEHNQSHNSGKDDELDACEMIKYFLGTCTANILVLVAFIGISNTWCILKLHPVANFCLLFAALTLLAYIEALHYGKFVLCVLLYCILYCVCVCES